jgi:basic amino acid/polyamine antiporter, APA family
VSGASASGATSPGVTTFAATAIVVADMVGVGVFTSLGFQVQTIGSGFSLMLLWLVGGIVAFCGATCYAELAAMFPRSSGEYNFLLRTYHTVFGFLAGWLSATVGFAAPVALAAMAFGEYAKPLLPGASPLALGLGVTWLVTIFHLCGVRYGAAFQNVSTVIKLVLIVIFVMAGFAIGQPQPISFAPAAGDFGQIVSAAFAVNLAFVMYAYSGWNASTYIIGEIHEPNRTLPRALFAGVAIVLVLYVALNAVFLYTTPMEQFSGQIQVATIVGEHIFGARGGAIVGTLICVGLISSISAMMWIGPRVTMVMGEDFPLLQLFAQKSKNGAPSFAIGFQLLVATVLLLTQSFEAVLDFIQFSLTLCSFFTVLGVIVLRYTKPAHPRPYRTWGYPVTPLIFLSVTFFMMYYLLINRPVQSLAGVVLMLAGLIIYGIAQLYPAVPATQKATIRK